MVDALAAAQKIGAGRTGLHVPRNRGVARPARFLVFPSNQGEGWRLRAIRACGRSARPDILEAITRRPQRADDFSAVSLWYRVRTAPLYWLEWLRNWWTGRTWPND